MAEAWVTVYKLVTRDLGSLVATGRWARRYPVGELVYPEPGSSLFCYASPKQAIRFGFGRVIRCRALLDPAPPVGMSADGRWAEFWQKRQGFWPLDTGTIFALCLENMGDVTGLGMRPEEQV